MVYHEGLIATMAAKRRKCQITHSR